MPNLVYAGQGAVIIGEWDASLKTLKNQYALGNATPVLKLSLERSTETIKESVSGQRLDYLEYEIAKTGNIELQIQDIDYRTFAQAMYGIVTDVSGSTVASETLPTVAVGDLYHTQHPDVSSLVITDSDGAPATLTPDTHYRIDDAKYGRITILDLASFTQPLNAAYTYDARTQIKPFTQTGIIRGLIFTGISTADSTQVRAIMPRVSFSPTSEFDFVNENAATLTLTGKLLLADVLSDDPILGKFGVIDILS